MAVLLAHQQHHWRPEADTCLAWQQEQTLPSCHHHSTLQQRVL